MLKYQLRAIPNSLQPFSAYVIAFRSFFFTKSEKDWKIT